MHPPIHYTPTTNGGLTHRPSCFRYRGVLILRGVALNTTLKIKSFTSVIATDY